MPSCLSEPSERGHLHDTKSGTSGRVNTLGQVAVHFHHSTRRLEHWFEIAQRELANRATVAAKARTNSQQHHAHLHPPRLYIAIQICGSRGDIQPFIPIAKLLQQPPYGHRVRICTHPAFKEFVVGKARPSQHIYSLILGCRRAMGSNSFPSEVTQRHSWRTW